MSAAHDRRGFLRGLAGLPLIGGAVTLIGNPVAAAEPITDDLRARYLGWLAREFTEALVEREWIGAERSMLQSVARGHAPDPGFALASAERRRRDLSHFVDPLLVPGCPPRPSEPPSTRAAVVLSAVGCDWRG